MGKHKKNKGIYIYQPNNIKLDIASRVVSWNGHILNKSIFNTLKPDNIVRISMHISKKSPFDCKLYRDSPYIKIVEFKDDRILGVIINELRSLPEHYYPLRTGEHIWFGYHHIIEILNVSEEDEKKYGTMEFVAYTGPLETIDNEVESSESEYDSDSTSSDSAEERNIDLTNKNINIKLDRGRNINY
jgi:hypothetical protein